MMVVTLVNGHTKPKKFGMDKTKRPLTETESPKTLINHLMPLSKKIPAGAFLVSSSSLPLVKTIRQTGEATVSTLNQKTPKA